MSLLLYIVVEKEKRVDKEYNIRLSTLFPFEKEESYVYSFLLPFSKSFCLFCD